MALTHLGGTFGGNQQPTKFLCLVLKMLQIQPEKEIIIEFIKNEDYKCVRLVGAWGGGGVSVSADFGESLEHSCQARRKRRPPGCLGRTPWRRTGDQPPRPGGIRRMETPS